MTTILAASALTMQNALRSAAAQSDRISHLWWLYFWVLISIFAVVSVFLVVGIGRSQFRREEPDWKMLGKTEPGKEQRITSVVTSAVGLTVVALFTLLIIDFFTGRA